MKEINKILIVITCVVVLAVLIFLCAQDLVWSGKLEVQTDFLTFTPYFSVLKPQDRVVRSEINYLKAEPIYFDLFLPRDFDTARVELKYQNDFDYQVFLGPNMKTGWDLKLLSGMPAETSGDKIASAEFELSDKNVNNGKLRFMISIPELDDETQGLDLKSARIILVRKPFWQDNILQNLFNYFKYVKNQF